MCCTIDSVDSIERLRPGAYCIGMFAGFIVFQFCWLDAFANDPLPQQQDRSVLAFENEAKKKEETDKKTKKEAKGFKIPSGLKEYVSRVTEVASEEKSANGLTIEVKIIPDAYRYEMAKGLLELERAGFAGVELKNKVRSLAAKHRSSRGKILILCDLTAGGGHFFLQKKSKHFQLTRKGKKTLKRKELEPKPYYQTWEIFIYTPNKRRGYKKTGLSRLTSQKWTFVSGSIDLKSSEPFDLSVANIVSQRPSNKATDSISPSQRQISCIRWDDIIVPKTTFTFHPGRWKIPEPPAGFDELTGKR